MKPHKWAPGTQCLDHPTHLWLVNENNNRDFLLPSLSLGSEGLHGFDFRGSAAGEGGCGYGGYGEE